MKRKTETSAFKSFIGSKSYRTVLCFVALICVGVSIFCYQYYRALQSTVAAESSSYLQEISSQIGKNASRTINDTFSMLGTVSTVLKGIEAESYQELEPIMKEQQDYWSFQSILLVDEKGVAHDAFGKKTALGSADYLREVMVDKTRSMSAAQMLNNQEYILFALPVTDLQVGGMEIHAIMAAYSLDSFDQILEITAFDGQGYAHIIRRDGTMAIRSSSPNTAVSGYNVLSSLNDATFDHGTLVTIQNDIKDGRSGLTLFELDGRREYLAYSPLETQEWSLLTFVPASVVNAQSDSLLRTTILLSGLITLTFALLITFVMLSSFRHRRKLEQIAYVDPVTGGNTIQKFYEEAQGMLARPDRPQYALIYTNIEKFKVFNEQFGRHSCDEMLRAIQHGISTNLKPGESMGRLYSDNFCVWAEYPGEAALVERFKDWYQTASQYISGKDAVWLMPVLEFGVYVVSNDTLLMEQMVDRAKLSLQGGRREMQGRGKMHYAIYDDATRKRLFREKHLEDMMEQALEDNEFQVYIQPKYCVGSETIGGAEALVRWQSSTDGMIYPDEFISLFEKNGFIIQLDLWVFEQVCISLRRWLDQGLEPVKISVNCSRIHLKNPDFLSFYIEACQRHQVPPRYLEIELTENVVFEDVEHLTRIINDIHGAGFGCSMDDFGSGYSSLNMIQDIPVDTIKLDKVFFRNDSKDISRTTSVIGSIMSMAKALKMEIVAEGVEERFQVDMLKSLNCDYIQGYYFAKPMPISDFEALAFKSKEPDKV